MKIFQSLIFISLLSTLSVPDSQAQARENEKFVQCESTDIHAGRLENNSWHCIINSDKKFRKIIGGKSGIDFTKYTLLGVTYTSGGCKSPDVNHSVYFSQTSNSYRYELNIQENGSCEPLFSGNIWCLIPKIGEDVKVDFVKNVTTKP